MTFYWLVGIGLLAAGILCRDRKAQEGFSWLPFELLVLAGMVACLFLYFVPRFGW